MLKVPAILQNAVLQAGVTVKIPTSLLPQMISEQYKCPVLYKCHNVITLHSLHGPVLLHLYILHTIWCIYSLLTSQIRIRVGEYDFSSVQEPYPFVERGVGRKVVHPKYNFFTYEYDLALVRLDSPLSFAPHIAPICLPASDDLLIGENATVTGWGRLSEGGTLPSILQEVRPSTC